MKELEEKYPNSQIEVWSFDEHRIGLLYGIYLEPLPPYSPELQPAERLWCLVDEPFLFLGLATHESSPHHNGGS